MHSLEALFTHGLSLIDQKVYQKLAAQYHKEYSQRTLPGQARARLLFLVTEFQADIEKHFTDIEVLSALHKDYLTTLNATVSAQDKQAVILDFLLELGATDIQGDKKAFRRWFDADVASERFVKIVATKERELNFLFNRFAFFLTQVIKLENDFFQTDAWQALNIKDYFLKAFYYSGDHRVKHYAFTALTNIIDSIPFEYRESSVSTVIKQFIVRFAQDAHQSIELQQDALNLLVKLTRESFDSILPSIIERKTKDYFFVRAHCAKLVCRYQHLVEHSDDYIQAFAQDESEYVRQKLFEKLLVRDSVDNLSLLLGLLQTESSHKVKASGILSMAYFSEYQSLDDFTKFSHAFFALLPDLDEYSQRCLLHVTPAIYQNLDVNNRSIWLSTANQALQDYKHVTASAKVRKWIAQAANYLWVFSNRERTEILAQLEEKINKLPLFKRRRLRLPMLNDLSNEELGRLLTIITVNDFPMDVKRKGGKLWVTRWHHFKFRLWRFIHELRNSTTDKRQAHLHMIGRVFYGNMSITSSVMGEQTVTKVPGEPLYEPVEDGPRNFLPLIDELISCVEQDWPIKPLEIYSNDGVTEVLPPRSFWKRLKLKLKLSWQFEKYAQMRNWSNKSQEKASHFIEAIRELGFNIKYRDYASESNVLQKEHESIGKFFALTPIPLLDNYWENIKTYFTSVYSNNLQHLIVFLAGLFGVFFAKHTWLNVQVNKARKDLPLSVGGWGTRGKSGTERLKAALFNGLGLNVISKTTGCEAMFLHGVAHGKLKEMFLFRPYDKATIWEQVNLLRLSTKLGADVFLWECMGLTPAYVHILQRHWMRDDFVTLTNTYPDHEDVQGPAGYDIPKVMVEFIPENSVMVTTEEVMYPILKHGAKKLGTRSHPVTWIETGRVTNDILERFPYEEHPNNIALVSRLADVMGISQDFALRSMADNVVLDLGVLKTYPASSIRGRTLQYVMGNSANERLGAMGNWTRMGFDQHDLVHDAGTWITTIINNRADRVPRSKVFASMLVKDVAADQHVLIGTNVDGFMKFLNEAWQEHYANYTIWGSSEEPHTPEQAHAQCEQKARSSRIVYSADILTARIRHMLRSIGIEEELDNAELNSDSLKSIIETHDKGEYLSEIDARYQAWKNELDGYQSIVSSLNIDKDKSNGRFIEFLKSSLLNRVLVVHDSMTSGEQITNMIADRTPLGFFTRIMGMQNIKGTGLDFVYRWQAWELCHAAGQKLYAKKPVMVAEGLQELKSFKEYGVLSKNYVLELLDEVADLKVMQSELFQAELTEIRNNLNEQMASLEAVTASSEETGKKDNPVFKALVNTAEKMVDIGDAVKRRKKADLIYKDMAAQRISHNRAALELQELTKRQKGGWLWKSIKNK